MEKPGGIGKFGALIAGVCELKAEQDFDKTRKTLRETSAPLYIYLAQI